MAEQTYSNHVRWYPLFHFVVMPLLLLNFLEHVVRIFTNSGEARIDQIFWALLGLTLILLALSARLQALKAQDRLIRLEERLRYRDVLPADLARRADALTLSQMIALRFAADDELAGLVERTLNGEFVRGRDIKMAIQSWRGDYVRV